MSTEILTFLTSGVMVAVIVGIYDIIKIKMARKGTTLDDLKKQLDEHSKQILDMEDERKNDRRMSELALRGLFYDRIKYLARKHISEGCIDFNDREDLSELHSIYHDTLGGNGNLDNLMAVVMRLPLKRKQN